ncbi:MAG: hypothetical protein DIU62_000525, partial [Pseudomonadota bacterium]
IRVKPFCTVFIIELLGSLKNCLLQRLGTIAGSRVRARPVPAPAGCLSYCFGREFLCASRQFSVILSASGDPSGREVTLDVTF